MTTEPSATIEVRRAMPWTLDAIREANSLTPEDWYWLHRGFDVGFQNRNPLGSLSWDWILLCQKLVWSYGEVETLARLNAQHTARAVA